LQNAAVRLVCKASKFDHASPLLVDLHWLPVKYRIYFKALHDIKNIQNIKDLLITVSNNLQDIILEQTATHY
jgi:hypothetical protein